MAIQAIATALPFAAIYFASGAAHAAPRRLSGRWPGLHDCTHKKSKPLPQFGCNDKRPAISHRAVRGCARADRADVAGVYGATIRRLGK